MKNDFEQELSGWIERLKFKFNISFFERWGDNNGYENFAQVCHILYFSYTAKIKITCTCTNLFLHSSFRGYFPIRPIDGVVSLLYQLWHNDICNKIHSKLFYLILFTLAERWHEKCFFILHCYMITIMWACKNTNEMHFNIIMINLKFIFEFILHILIGNK